MSSEPSVGPVVLVGLVFLALVAAVFLVLKRSFVRPGDGEVLVVSTPKGPKVSFSGRLVIPVLHRAELMDVSLKHIKVRRSGSSGLLTADNLRVDVASTFFVRVGRSDEDVLLIARSLGCTQASNPETVAQLFQARFVTALEHAAETDSAAALVADPASFRQRTLAALGDDLLGFRVDELTIDRLEKTPLDALDPNDMRLSKNCGPNDWTAEVESGGVSGSAVEPPGSAEGSEAMPGRAQSPSVTGAIFDSRDIKGSGR